VRFFDTAKAKAGDVAVDAERTGRLAAARIRLIALQNDLKKAERELGQATYEMIEHHAPDQSALTAAIARVQAAHTAIAAKEAQIAELRSAAEAPPAEAGQAGGVELGPPQPAEPPAAPQIMSGTEAAEHIAAAATQAKDETGC
jgi:hypothetical protein